MGRIVEFSNFVIFAAHKVYPNIILRVNIADPASEIEKIKLPKGTSILKGQLEVNKAMTSVYFLEGNQKNPGNIGIYNFMTKDTAFMSTSSEKQASSTAEINTQIHVVSKYVLVGSCKGYLTVFIENSNGALEELSSIKVSNFGILKI
jgi:hypothetical protein